MYFKQFFDEKLAQYAYLIGCQAEGTAVIIDPMRDIDQYIDAAAKEKLTIIAAADTHIHADYISGLREFAERGVKIYASDEGDKEWKYEWLLNSEYDYELLKDGDEFEIGNILIKAWHTPGHICRWESTSLNFSTDSNKVRAESSITFSCPAAVSRRSGLPTSPTKMKSPVTIPSGSSAAARSVIR